MLILQKWLHGDHDVPYTPEPPHSEITEMSSLNVESKTEIGLGSNAPWKLPRESVSASVQSEYAESS